MMKLILEIKPKPVTAFIIRYDYSLYVKKYTKSLLLANETIMEFHDPVKVLFGIIQFTAEEKIICYEYLKQGKTFVLERQYDREYVDVIRKAENVYTAVLFKSYKITDMKSSFDFISEEPFHAIHSRVKAFNSESDIYQFLEMHDYERLKRKEEERKKIEKQKVKEERMKKK